MQLVMPEILDEARCLSVGFLALTFLLGVFLWLFGWWSHRFWIVLTTTVLAGLYGLYESATFQTHPMLAGLLLALSAGLLALSLVRILAFVAGGLAGLWAVQALAPNINHLVPCFLVCGLFGFLLFRLWMMALTSLAGCLLAGYAGLVLLDLAGVVNAVELTETRTVLVNWICVGLAATGVIGQFLLSRWSSKEKKSEKKEPRLKDSWDILSVRSGDKPVRKAG